MCVYIYIYTYTLSFQTGKTQGRRYKNTWCFLQNLGYVQPILKVRLSTGKVRVQCGSNTGFRTKTRGFPKKLEVFLDMWKYPRLFLAPVEFYRCWCFSGYGYESFFFLVDRSTAIHGYGVGPRVWFNFDSCPNETMWFSSGPWCYGIMGAPLFSKLVIQYNILYYNIL